MKKTVAKAATLQNDVRISSRSCWKDAIWHLDGVRPGVAPSNFSINWGFSFCEDRFTDAKWSAWCSAAKTFLWSLKIDPAPGRPTVEPELCTQPAVPSDDGARLVTARE